MRNKFLTFVAAVILLPAAVFAQTARDADIDSKLNAGTLAGIAPPTGSQSAPATATNNQKFLDPYLPAAIQTDKVILGQTDGKARAYEVQGNVTVVKKGSPDEVKLRKGDILEAGDKIYTDAGSAVSITFDENYKNAVHVTENSKAVFEGIEPTNIRIINGSIFSAVDGLPQGSTWKVTTPAAVAAVRGTLYLVNFQASSGQFFAATVNVPDDGKASAIDIQEVKGGGSANVAEGKEITLKQGQSASNSLVKDLDTTVLTEVLNFFEKLIKLRNDESNSGAPPTGGEFFEPNTLDPAGPGNVGGGNDKLDVNDLGTIKKDAAPEPVITEEGSNQSPGDKPGDEFPGNGCGEDCS